MKERSKFQVRSLMMILTQLKFTAREDFFASHCRANLYTKSWGLGDERLHHRDRNECSFHIHSFVKYCNVAATIRVEDNNCETVHLCAIVLYIALYVCWCSSSLQFTSLPSLYPSDHPIESQYYYFSLGRQCRDVQLALLDSDR